MVNQIDDVSRRVVPSLPATQKGTIQPRATLNTLGDAYVETLPGEELQAIASSQIRKTAGQIQGTAVWVSLPEGILGQKVIGRFGWKAQHASLISTSAEALRSELGISNKYFSTQGVVETPASSLHTSYAIEAIVQFLRSTEPVPPSFEQAATESAKLGSRLFDQIGCSICHIRTLTTAPAGTHLNGGTLLVSERLGSKKFHPFSDYLLHDVGTGDGVVQNIRPEDYDPSTANKFRTAPLWGVRFRSWLMHDGQSVTYHQAIMRHGGEATEVVKNYMRLTPVEKEQLRQFLGSLCVYDMAVA